MSTDIADIVEFAASDGGAELMQDVLRHELPPVLESLIDEYVTLDGARDRFMWQWVHRLAPQNTLPSVESASREKVATDKTLVILYITLLDDVLERRRDWATFEEAAKLPFPHRRVDWNRPGVDIGYVEFAMRVWQTIEARLESAPGYDDYAPLLVFDLKQAVNAIEYTNLAIDRPDLSTMHDLESYESHNMVMYAYLDVDLMHSPPAYKADLEALRRAVWPAQQMARIGNWLSTWERELREGDYSSGILVFALRNGVVTPADLEAVAAGDEAAYEAVVERVADSGIEAHFMSRWDAHLEALRAIDGEVPSMDLTPFIDGLKVVLQYHLASRGLK